MDTFNFITCRSVDDGKSTLIGRLLFESKSIFDSQLTALEKDSPQHGTQGITIDVAYRFFATEQRRFRVAETLGHEQYTRNMATGASPASVTVILIDARKGVLVQTRRSSCIVAMMGVKQVVLAVNKMELIGFDLAAFEAIVADYTAFAAGLGFASLQAIPLSGLNGDNVLQHGARLPWYSGLTPVHYLNKVATLPGGRTTDAFRMPVQWVNRPNLNFRGFCDRIAAGTVHPSDAVTLTGSSRCTARGG